MNAVFVNAGVSVLSDVMSVPAKVYMQCHALNRGEEMGWGRSFCVEEKVGIGRNTVSIYIPRCYI